MRNLARAAADERAAYVNETAARRNVPACGYAGTGNFLT